MSLLREAFEEIIAWLVQAAEHGRPESAWKAIVKTYLSIEHCNRPERGCPLTALAPELARAGREVKGQILAEMISYKDQLLRLMPGRRVADKERAFFVIFSTMIGAVEMGRILPDPTARKRILASARDFLLRSF